MGPPLAEDVRQEVDSFIEQVAFAKFRFENYDGGIPAHAEPEQSGIFLLTEDGRWQFHPENSTKYFFGGLDAYGVQTQETDGQSCSVLLYDNDNPSVQASFAIPATGSEELQSTIADCRVEAVSQAEDLARPGPDLSEAQLKERLQTIQRGLRDMATARKRIELQVEQLFSMDAKLHNQARQALTQNRENVAREALTRRANVAAQIKSLRVQNLKLIHQEDRLLSVPLQHLGPVSLHCATVERTVESKPHSESEATPTLALQNAWWQGIEPAMLRGVELNPGRKPDYTGKLYVTERAGLKDDGPTKVWGLYYRGSMFGNRWWLPLSGVSKIELAEADIHPNGMGCIGFGLVGMAAVLAAKEVSQHRAKAVRLLTVTDRKGTVYHFQTNTPASYVVNKLANLVQLYTAKVNADRRVLTEETAAMHEELQEAAEEKRKAEIREQAQAIAEAMAPHGSVADELVKLAQLKEAGVLTEEEFAAQKAKLLS
ncbi:MAG: SHOCT domain-containing protein [Acidimicrobiales bacterium]